MSLLEAQLAVENDHRTEQMPLSQKYRLVRSFTEYLCEPLQVEDYVIQSMEDVSPTKWHLAHTTWFFETFVLREYDRTYRPLNEKYAYLFNSYYIQAGDRHCRPRRGMLSRPTVDEVMLYRRHVDEAMERILDRLPAEAAGVVEIGLNHEQQHQELIVTDVKHVLAENFLPPVYRSSTHEGTAQSEMSWISFDGGIVEIGSNGPGFHYDNEGPAHRVFLEDFDVASRLVTNREFIAFMSDGGYSRAELWLSEGWSAVQNNRWESPSYWQRDGDSWLSYTLSGVRPVDPDEPVTHVSYFEADAYSRWAGVRLPTEQEWEVASRGVAIDGNFVEEGRYHPAAAQSGDGSLMQMFGDAWEWTRSQYSPYPGYYAGPGALGEYNGKFMCNQFVLRGGSCATSITHIRPTYRNFFHPAARWQFTGIRLAREAT